MTYIKCLSGCKDGACIGGETNICDSIGLRKEGKYCSADKIWETQIESGGECENNFECDSYVCVSNECVNSNLIQKILNWFKRLFGLN